MSDEYKGWHDACGYYKAHDSTGAKPGDKRERYKKKTDEIFSPQLTE